MSDQREQTGINVTHFMFGRKVLYTDIEEITRDNVISVLSDVLPNHYANRSDIDYLYNYYKGRQPIIYREKDIRPEINNIIVENRANEIVTFKTGYLLGEPVQYVSRGDSEEMVTDILRLNDYMFAEDKASGDKELADWFHICGTAYRMIIPDKYREEDESPFEIYTLDPRDSFVVYWSGVSHKAVMGVKYVTLQDGTVLYSVYTPTRYFEIVGGQEIVREEPNYLGAIPIVEYPANTARLGSFEIVISLLDALNTSESNRLDGVEQFIQALLVFKGVDITDPQYAQLKDQGAIKVPPDGDVKYIAQELNQSQTETLTSHLYDSVLTIVGMPNRNMNATSTSDTGASVILRNGWSDAEARAKDTELMFKRAEKQFLKVAITICNFTRNMHLRLADIEIRFTRRNYENIAAKSAVLTAMLANDKIHPKLAFEYCGMFADPEVAYDMSQAYYREQEEELAQELDNFVEQNGEEDRQRSEVDNEAEEV